MQIRRIGECVWEIPKHGGMRVPGRVYASAEMMDGLRADPSLQQVANVAHLPGIVGYSLAMPDIHWGYGFPIGGVAAVDADEGVISPGGIGFDINCLSGDAQVLGALGYYRTIREIVERRLCETVRSFGFSPVEVDRSDVEAGMSEGARRVLDLHGAMGHSLAATTDHPFLTPSGMKVLGELRPGDQIAVHPFRGVPWEDPGHDVLVSEDDVRRFLESRGKSRGNTVLQVIRSLEERGLLPVRRSSAALPVLIKVLGFVLGDGTLYFTGRTGKGFIWFFGQPDDLEDIRRDLLPLFRVSRVYSRQRAHAIATDYGEVRFETTNSVVRATSTSLAVLLALLGCPVGNRSIQDYETPLWLRTAPLWQKRLFLAAYFGAELQSPRPFAERDRNFPCPLLTLQKVEAFAESGRRFLEQIGDMTREFGVQPMGIGERRETTRRRHGHSVRLRLVLSSRPESLRNLYERIGYEYNRKRQAGGCIVAAYQRCKERAWRERNEAIAEIVRLRALLGLSAKAIHARLRTEAVNLRFVERTIYGRAERAVRVSERFPSFAEFRAAVTEGLGDAGLVWDTITDIIPRNGLERVYDIGVGHGDHNFVANGFVVHNCGVRLVTTRLQAHLARERLPQIADALFAAIPCGVGAEGGIPRLGKSDEKKLVRDGVRWAIANGYGQAGDEEHIEENGCLEGADPEALSEEALTRGLTQVGTLGSGNHFLEVGRVDEIYDRTAAQTLGLETGQVTVIIHSGSRGLGHQTCDDALRVMTRAMEKYGIAVPDRQLACAPLGSPEGKRYLAGMACAANYAWVNRQVMMALAERAFLEALRIGPHELGFRLVYDVCHNIAKPETHEVDGRRRRVWVHRKGATRAFGPGHPAIPKHLRAIGQPVLIPGDMGRYSFVLVGTEGAMRETFGSTCHGAGRLMSRAQAKKASRGRSLEAELAEAGVTARYRGRGTFAEEMPYAYKDVADVIDVVDRAGISRKVARLRPMAVIKG